MAIDLNPRTKIVVLVALTGGMFFNTMNVSVVGPAMPKAVGDLGGLELFGWVFTAPLITSTLSIPVAGKLSDIYGRKPFFLAGLAIYILGNLLAGFSQDMIQLIVFRGITGIGQGLVTSMSFALIADLFPPRERGKWMGLNSVAMGFGSFLGPVAGGVLTDQFSWRGVFFINIPLGLATMLVFARALPGKERVTGKARIDYLGIALLTAAILPFLVAISLGGEQFAWRSVETVAMIGVSIVLFVLFLVREARTPDPILEISLFRRPFFALSAVVGLAGGFAMWSGFMFLPLYLQAVLDTSATQSGFVQIPMMLGLMVGGFVGGQLLSRTGRFQLLGVVGSGLMALAFALLWMMDTETGMGTIVRNMVLAGIGVGITLPVYLIAAQNAMPAQYLGVVTATITFCRQMGGAIGVAVIGSVLNNTLARAVISNTPDEVKEALPPETLMKLQDPQLLLNSQTLIEIRGELVATGPAGGALFDQMIDSLKLSLSDAISVTYLVCLAVAVLAIVVGLFMRDSAMRSGVDEPDVSPAPPSRDASAAPSAKCPPV